MADRRELHQLETEIQDPFVRRAAKGAYHVRRYQPFYVFTLVWVLMLALFPSVNPLNEGGGDDGFEGVAAGPESDYEEPDGVGEASADTGGTPTTGARGADELDSGGADVTADATAAGAGGGGSDPSESTGGTGTAPADGSAGAAGATSGDQASGGDAAPAGDVFSRSGTTRGLGVECNGGDQRQIPWSFYAAPCVPTYDGPNGGATARGVTADKIVIVRREFPESANSRAASEVNEQAGFASEETADQVRDDFIGWFNQVYEMYGRQVEIVEYESENGDSTAEAQSKGKEGACLDADQIAEEIGAFAVWDGGTGPFGECAAERGLVHFNAGAYFPESWYRTYHPFLYNDTMECERISYQVAEYVGKRIAGDQARWAGDPLYQQQERKFGTYVPDNDEYQHCVSIYRETLQQEYGHDPGPKYDYILDFSRFADEAAKGVIQFKTEGVTSLILACDPYSVIFLTQQAESQDWHPEWVLIGVAATDTDNFGRLYTQSQVDGHMFGMSQLGDITKLIGPGSEAGQSYEAIPPDQRSFEEMPEGTNGDYYDLIHVWNGLQLAGPELTPEALFEGYCTRYGSGGEEEKPAGLWRFTTNPDGTEGCDHTAVEDSREIYWDGQAEGPDGDQGTFIPTYGGQRFTNGEWPDEAPPIYPDR